MSFFSMDYQTYFVDSLENLINDLQTYLPSDSTIKSNVIRYQATKKVMGKRIIMVTFFEAAQPHLGFLWKKDPMFFDKIRGNAVADFGSSETWNGLTDKQKDTIWTKIEAMVLLAAKAMGIPESRLQTN